MKKILPLFLIVICQVTLLAQPLAQREYQLLVTSSSNKNCPLYDDGCLINNLTYKSNALHFNITVSEERLQQHSVDEVRKYLSERLTHRQEWHLFTYMYDHLTDVKGGLSYDFHLEDDNKQLTDSSFFIAVSGDEENVIDEFEDDYASFKELLRQELSVDDEGFKYALQLCIYANMGFRYCFFDSHDRKVDFISSVEEIEEILKEQE